MTLWPNYFDVVILPPENVWRHSIELSKQLHRRGGVFVLGDRNYLPHISIYHIPVLPEDFSEFSKTVRDVALQSPGGELRLKSIEMPAIMTDKPAWLSRLHRKVVNATLPYFDWNYGAEELWRVDYLPARLRAEARRNLRKFGSPMIERVFRPHITMTSSASPLPADIDLQLRRLEFSVRQIAVCELGPHHTCQRVIATYPLAGIR